MYPEVTSAEKLLKRTFWLPKIEILIFMTGGSFKRNKRLKCSKLGGITIIFCLKVLKACVFLSQFNVQNWYLKNIQKIIYKIKQCVK